MLISTSFIPAPIPHYRLSTILVFQIHVCRSLRSFVLTRSRRSFIFFSDIFVWWPQIDRSLWSVVCIRSCRRSFHLSIFFFAFRTLVLSSSSISTIPSIPLLFIPVGLRTRHWCPSSSESVVRTTYLAIKRSISAKKRNTYRKRNGQCVSPVRTSISQMMSYTVAIEMK